MTDNLGRYRRIAKFASRLLMHHKGCNPIAESTPFVIKTANGKYGIVIALDGYYNDQEIAEDMAEYWDQTILQPLVQALNPAEWPQ